MCLKYALMIDICLNWRSRGMGSILTKTHIAHQVTVGQGCEAAVGEAGEGPDVAPAVGFAYIHKTLPDAIPIVALQWVFKDGGQQAGIAQGGPLAEIAIVVLPAASPAGPTPTVVVAAEVVAAIAAPLAILEVVAADAPHPRVVAVAFQQVGAVREKVGVGNAVVLEDDALLHLLKKPTDGAAHPQAAALVHIGIEALDVAWPVDLVLDHRAGGGHLLGFAGAGGVGSVAGDKKARGCHRADCVDHLAQGVGATPGD